MVFTEMEFLFTRQETEVVGDETPASSPIGEAPTVEETLLGIVEHKTVSAERKHANKQMRLEQVGEVITMSDGVKWTVREHIKGMLYLMTRGNDVTRYAAHNASKSVWDWWDHKGPTTDSNAGAPPGLPYNGARDGITDEVHHSSCCGTAHRKIRYHGEFAGTCLACQDDTPTQRNNRRILNGRGPASIFDERGQLT